MNASASALRVPVFRNRLGTAIVTAMFTFAFLLLLAIPSGAQNVALRDKIVAALPPEAQNVMTRLSSLSELPDGAWKMHSGDMAHGETISLDESNWQPIAKEAKAPNDAVWFRQTITVPPTLNGYDLTGARIWFQFHANANGPMPQILYFNGRRVALGDDLEPIVLLDEAKPGDKIVVAVKLLHTVDQKIFRGATMRIEFPASRPNPAALRTEFMSAALLVPSLAPGDASKEATLTDAIEAVDLKALDAHDQAKFDASLKASQAKLEALRPLLQSATFYLTGNSHIDAAWLWPWTETVDVVKRTFGTALQLMYEYPNYTYTQSAAAYNEWMAQKYPDLNDQIKQRIKEGRWEVVGGMWVEPDLNMPDGESLVRQLLVGKRWYKQNYGVDVRIGWNPDSFGYTWQLPQIYKKSGVDYFVTQKMTWNDTNQLPFKLFWWESPDGSKVLAYFPHDYANDNLNPVRLADDLATARTRSTGMTDMMDLYGVGDHGGGPTRAILDEGEAWTPGSTVPQAEAEPVMPKLQWGIAQNYFSSVEKQVAPESQTWDYSSIAKGYTAPAAVEGKVSIPTWKSELYFEYHRGVMTTQANHKRNMREASEEVLNAEKWSSLAWLDGKAYPGAELTEDWKKVLFNQFHDLAAGSGIGVIYKDAQKDYDVVRWSTNEIDSSALETVAARINTTAGEKSSAEPAIVVFNPLGWERSGEVKATVQVATPFRELRIAENGAKNESLVAPTIVSRTPGSGQMEISFHAEGIPAMGYKVFHVVPVDRSEAATPVPPYTPKQETGGKELVLQNERDGLSVHVSTDTGCITSLRDEKTKYEWLASGACGNELQAFKDTPKDYDAWNIDPGTLDAAPTLINKADSVVMVGDQLHHGVRVTRTWQSSKFVQTIWLEPGTDYVDIDNEIDWHESHVLLKAAFPLAASSDHATYEIPYGSIDRTTLRTNSWEKAQFEVPAQQWADLGDGQHGLSVINESKFGYDAVGNVLRLTLLRSPKWPDPDADMGHHHFHYAIYPHAGTWQQAMTVRHGFEYNYPLTAVVTTAHSGELPAAHSFASVSPDNIVLTAMKKAEDTNSLIFRAYEWAGKAATVEFHVPPGATGATVTNMMETPEGDALSVSGDTVKAPIKPFEILTVRVDYPGK
ncbi:alpha-mannosidase [Acidicapsa acidisoli]|uniref:alpha-mannosidase n=1 Tax=Acidicapsa acidisoli TaxID=1615681 RepID=UPI0021DFAC04|nr:glycoside hydrolase family 38 C-terminal domain-containing protein [Acidicapsa acidisoli]